MFLCAASLSGSGQQTSMPESEYRAKILTLLGRSTTWPERPGLDTKRPLVIGVLGVHPFEDQLDKLVQGLAIQNRRVTVRYMRRLDPPRLVECDILYLCESEDERLSSILKMLKGNPILVVGGTSGYAFRGVMLNLFIKDGVFSPEVNLKALREAGIEIHPTFLAKAKVKVVE